MKIKKNWMLALGTPIVAISPVVAVVSCGTTSAMAKNENAITPEEKKAYSTELANWQEDWSTYAWSKTAIKQKYVDEEAFYHVDLTNVTSKTGKKFYLPRFIESIGDRAFWNAQLPTSFKLVDTKTAREGYKTWSGVKSLGQQAFKGIIFPALENPDFIPDSVWSIDNECFNSSVLPEGFKIKPSVIELGSDVFAGSTVPQNFTFNPDMTELSDGTFSAATLKGNLTIPDKIHVIGSRSFQGVDFTGKTLKYSSDIYKIKSEAFEGAKFNEKFIVADKVQEIQEKAFAQSELNGGIQIGEKESRLTEISENTFNGAKVLVTFDLSKATSITTINAKAFVSTQIPADFTIPSTVRVIAQLAFQGVDFTGINHPETFLYGDGIHYSIDNSKLSPTSFQGVMLPRGFRLWGEKSGLNSTTLGSAFNSIVLEPGLKWNESDTTGPKPGAKII